MWSVKLLGKCGVSKTTWIWCGASFALVQGPSHSFTGRDDIPSGAKSSVHSKDMTDGGSSLYIIDSKQISTSTTTLEKKRRQHLRGVLRQEPKGIPVADGRLRSDFRLEGHLHRRRRGLGGRQSGAVECAANNDTKHPEQEKKKGCGEFFATT